jgi:hypothetical protein
MNNYKKTMERFGLNTNLPEPQFERPVKKLSEAERVFLLSEKKWHIDHDEIKKDEVNEELENEDGEDENGTK